MNVVFFGDSITAGEGTSPNLHFASLLARDIDEEYGGFNVINSGYNSDTTRRALERMPNDVQRFNPVLLVAQFGMNDCNRWETDKGMPRVSYDSYCANVQEIAKRACVFGARAVIFLTSHPTKKTWQYEAGRRNYNHGLRVTATKHGIDLVDIEVAWPNDDDLLIDDIHLSAAGHEFYRHMLEPYIMNALQGVAV